MSHRSRRKPKVEMFPRCQKRSQRFKIDHDYCEAGCRMKIPHLGSVIFEDRFYLASADSPI